MAPHIARWDLDKTYLRTEFDTLADIVRTALERPDEKTTNPGASTLLREMVRSGVSVHILSGSPEQMRRRLEDKLRLDGITWESFTLKPNLKNVLRLRFRAVRDQLGYKLPSLLRSRASLSPDETARRESLFGDDAEADAFVYSLYADVVAGRVDEERLATVLARGRVYPDVAEGALALARSITHVDAVERIFIHLEGQSPPAEFQVYGSRAVPFYNYLQAAFVLFEDERLPAEGVLRVAVELAVEHNFDGDALARSYVDLGRRGHLRGTRGDELAATYAAWTAREKIPADAELSKMIARLPAQAKIAAASWRGEDVATPDYVALVEKHNPRGRR